MKFTIRDLKSYDEMVALRRLQLEIWGFADPNTGLYPPVLNTAAKNGGVVLGAFDNETGQMIGFIFGFLGREPGGPFKLCSQAMGVLETWRGQGVAEALKQTQRARVLAQDLPLITWTFDPLEGPNAHLNLHKLRAIVHVYWRDVYGSNFGELNVGLPTDRLVAEWWVKGKRLQQGSEELQWYAATPIFELEGKRVERRIVRSNLVLEDDLLQLEIPADIHPVKATNMELAFDWRMKVRKAFERYFEKGYIAVDFISTIERGTRRNRYILQKGTPALLAQIGLTEVDINAGVHKG